MSKIIQLQRYLPDPDGTGGSHRMYQVYQDLVSSGGEDNVVPFLITLKHDNKLQRFFSESRERLRCLQAAIVNMFSPTLLTNELLRDVTNINSSFSTFPIDTYKEFISINGKPSLCILDFPNFVQVANYNKENDITTIYIPQNLESFAILSGGIFNEQKRIDSAINWRVESEILSLSNENLMISKIETNVLRGLGLSATYYPYHPSTEIRERLLRIRESRQKFNRKDKLILLIGSAFYKPTMESMKWVLTQIMENNKLNDVKIVVGGKGTEFLRNEFGSITNLDIRGKLKQDELNQLMTNATAILIPQLSGFGSLTRIIEMSCANVPAITSEYALASMDCPPGVYALPNNGKAWLNALENISDYSKGNSYEEYHSWETNQPNPIKEIIDKYC